MWGILPRQCCPTNTAIEASLVGILVVKSCRDWFENSRNVFEMFTVRSFSACCWICRYKLCRDSHLIATFYARFRSCSICYCSYVRVFVCVCVRVTYHTYLARFLCSVCCLVNISGICRWQECRAMTGETGLARGRWWGWALLALPAAVTDM